MGDLLKSALNVIFHTPGGAARTEHICSHGASPLGSGSEQQGLSPPLWLHWPYWPLCEIRVTHGQDTVWCSYSGRLYFGNKAFGPPFKTGNQIEGLGKKIEVGKGAELEL